MIYCRRMDDNAKDRQGHRGRGREGPVVSQVLLQSFTKVKCTGPHIGTRRYCTVQSPGVEPIRAPEVRGSSRQQPAASRGASLRRPPPPHRDGVMLGGLTLVKHGFPVLAPNVRAKKRCDVRDNVSQCLFFRAIKYLITCDCGSQETCMTSIFLNNVEDASINLKNPLRKTNLDPRPFP